MATFSRRKKPPDGKRHGWYKDCLRLDFQFRCAYCLIHEADYQGLRSPAASPVCQQREQRDAEDGGQRRRRLEQ